MPRTRTPLYMTIAGTLTMETLGVVQTTTASLGGLLGIQGNDDDATRIAGAFEFLPDDDGGG